jgi:hypothetical protein
MERAVLHAILVWFHTGRYAGANLASAKLSPTNDTLGNLNEILFLFSLKRARRDLSQEPSSFSH